MMSHDMLRITLQYKSWFPNSLQRPAIWFVIFGPYTFKMTIATLHFIVIDNKWTDLQTEQ